MSDTSFLKHLIDDKIKSKMNELKQHNFEVPQDKSILDFTTLLDDRDSFLDYTMDKGNMLVKKPKGKWR